jgi:hypothetical protein
MKDVKWNEEMRHVLIGHLSPISAVQETRRRQSNLSLDAANSLGAESGATQASGAAGSFPIGQTADLEMHHRHSISSRRHQPSAFH